jgi:DnaJ-class molecular chaperone
MRYQSYDSRGSTAEYRVVITRAVAAAGARRRISFHGPDGRERSLMVDIPAGVTSGTRLPVELADAVGSELSYGELVLLIVVVPHQVSECRGPDLLVTLQADRATALREGRIEVPLGDGRVLAVPVQPGTTHSRYVYAGQGLPRGYAPRRCGDLILRLELLDVDESASESATPSAEQLPQVSPRSWWQALFGT